MSNVTALERIEKPTGALALTSDQIQWTDLQRAALAQIGLDKADDANLSVFLHYCQRTGMDPFTRQIYMIGRWDYSAGRLKYTIQMAIDGFRIIAQRSLQYAGQTEPQWCGPDGVWKDVWVNHTTPPVAARVGVLRHGWPQPTYAVAHFAEFAPTKKDGSLEAMWKRMPANQISKCFSPDTEVLTDAGFRLFSDVRGARIMQVTPDGLEAVDAEPFVQIYDGPMIANHSDMLDFLVTPNHDMVTTVGKVEASAMHATSTLRGVWRIPMVAPGRTTDDSSVDDADLRLAGYILADGWHNGHQRFNVAVSREYKRLALAELAPASTNVQHSQGSVAESAVRDVRSNFDKQVFSFHAARVARFMDAKKVVNLEAFASLSQRQVRIVVDAWQEFDGHTNRKTGVRRFYTSREDHLAAMEVLAALAGYSVNVPRKRQSDISEAPGYSLTISETKPLLVSKPWRDRPGIHEVPENEAGVVWCVTVPSGQIVVRRRGFSMVVGNCAEAAALRKAFPNDLSGMYVPEELEKDAEYPIVEQPAKPEPEVIDWDARIAEVATDYDKLRALWTEAKGLEPNNLDLLERIAAAGTAAKEAAEQQTEVIEAEVVEDSKAPLPEAVHAHAEHTTAPDPNCELCTADLLAGEAGA